MRPDNELITRDSIWRTQDHHRVAIKDMDDKHLLNTIRVLRDMSPLKTKFRTSAVRRRNWINAMANEAYSRGLILDELQPTELVHE